MNVVAIPPTGCSYWQHLDGRSCKTGHIGSCLPRNQGKRFVDTSQGNRRSSLEGTAISNCEVACCVCEVACCVCEVACCVCEVACCVCEVACCVCEVAYV